MEDLARGCMSIRIGAAVAKTRQVRIVRVRPTLQAFLDLVPEEERKGKIIPQSIVRKAAGLQNRADAARHSFASYALGIGDGVDAVRDDMGHARGSDMLFRHYRTAVMREAAEAYWAISPASVAAIMHKKGPLATSSWCSSRKSSTSCQSSVSAGMSRNAGANTGPNARVSVQK